MRWGGWLLQVRVSDASRQVTLSLTATIYKEIDKQNKTKRNVKQQTKWLLRFLLSKREKSWFHLCCFSRISHRRSLHTRTHMHTWEACRIMFAANTRTLGKANAFTDIFSYDRHTCFFFFLFLVWREFQGATRKSTARDKLWGSFACCLRKEKKMLTVFILQRIEANDRGKAGSISQHPTLFEFRIFFFLVVVAPYVHFFVCLFSDSCNRWHSCQTVTLKRAFSQLRSVFMPIAQERKELTQHCSPSQQAKRRKREKIEYRRLFFPSWFAV